MGYIKFIIYNYNILIVFVSIRRAYVSAKLKKVLMHDDYH